jgi:hypothetical protein
MRRAALAALGLMLWPHATALEPPLNIPVAGFQLLMLARPAGKVMAPRKHHAPRGRSIEAILRDPLGP